MILVDTSVWVDHLREGNDQLAACLNAAEVVCHPMIVGELALGSLAKRADILGLLDNLPSAPIATMTEVRTLIETRKLYSRGIGLVDAYLLASCLLAPGARFWTQDKRLADLAEEFGMAVP